MITTVSEYSAKLEMEDRCLREVANYGALNDTGYRTLEAIRDLLFYTAFYKECSIEEFLTTTTVMCILEAYADCPLIRHTYWHAKRLNDRKEK